MAIKNVRSSRGRTYPAGYSGKKNPGKAVASIDLGRIINQVVLSDSADKKMQKKVYETVTNDFQVTYERYYKQLLREIQQHLNVGFPISSRKNASVRVKVTNPMGSDVTFVPNAGKGWQQLSPDYLRQKAGHDRANNALKFSDKRTKAGKAGMFTHRYGSDKVFRGSSRGRLFAESKITARQRRDGSFKTALDKPEPMSMSGQRFWIFRRNLAAAADLALNPNQAKVTFTQKDVQRSGVGVVKVSTNKTFSEEKYAKDKQRERNIQRGDTGLGHAKARYKAIDPGVVRMNKPITIGYTAGLKFSTLPTPLNNLVRKPFIQGHSAGVMVLDSGADASRKKGIRVLALVEAKRPFIVELSGIMGKLARKRLKI